MIRVKRLPEEVWKPVPDLPFIFENKYEISNHGRVRRIEDGFIYTKSVKHNSDTWLRINIRKIFKLSKFGSNKAIYGYIYPHRLVYRLFGEPIPPKHHIYHINNDRSENGIWNLGVINKRNNRRRIARKRKEGWYLPRRAPRYFHDR